MKFKTLLILLFFFLIFLFDIQTAFSSNIWQDGTLVKTSDSPRVYVMYNSLKRWIRSPMIFESYGFKWNQIKIVKTEVLNQIPDAVLVRYFLQPRVYVLENNQKRWIISAKVFEQSGYSWHKIHLINKIELDNHPTGLTITKKITKESEEEEKQPTSSLTSQFQSGPPAVWPEWLKNEREVNIEDVLETEERLKKNYWKSFQNDNLPQFIEWAKEHEIKLIGTKRTYTYIASNMWNPTTDKMSLTAVAGIDQHFEDLKKIPSHLIKLLKNQAIFFSSAPNVLCYTMSLLPTVELTQEYQKKPAELPLEAIERGRTCIPASLFFDMVEDRCTWPKDIFHNHGVGGMIHEFGHIVYFNGIRMYKGYDFAFGKTDEEIRSLYEEYNRVFQVTEEQKNWTDNTKPPPGMISTYGNRGVENFAVHFDAYIDRPQYFRERSANEPGLAEKYEFLKTRIFLGQEY